MVKYVLILFYLHKNKSMPDMFMFRERGVSFPMKLSVKIWWGRVKWRLSFAMFAAGRYGRDSWPRFHANSGHDVSIRFARGRRVVIQIFGPGDRNDFTVLKFGFRIDFVANPLVQGVYWGILHHYAIDAKYYKWFCMFSQNWNWALNVQTFCDNLIWFC